MRRSAFGLAFAALFAACSTLVGADFEGLELAAGGAEAGSSGEAGAGGDAGQGGGASGEGGTTGGEGGESGSGGEPSAGAGGSPVGGEGGAGGMAGAAGGAGEGGAAGEGGGMAGGAGMPGCVTAGAGGANGEGSVVLNEIKGQGAGDDFIELYNPGPETVDLTGYGVSDGSNTLVFPSGTTLEACGFLLILLGQPAPGGGGFTCFTPNPCFHQTWGVSSSGEVIVVRDAASTVVDSATYPDEGLMIVVDGQTWGRLPDGSGAFRATLPTPEAPNTEE